MTKKKLRECRKCGDEKSLEDEFYSQTKSGQKTYYRTECKVCQRKMTRKLVQKKPEIYIYQNAKREDRYAGRECTITRLEVGELVKKPCDYCGVKDKKMSIDRMENEIGHTKDNTVPCCLRCNTMKRDMPLAAWLAIAPAIRRARKKGLFGDWVPHNRGSKKLGAARSARKRIKSERE